MHRITLLLLVGFSALFYSCKKNNEIIYDFTQYTETDSTGSIIGGNDTTDWGYDGSWSSGELSLLSFKDSLVAGDSTTGTVEISPAFPNPGHGIVLIGVNTEKSCKMKAVVVDEDFHILYLDNRLFTGGPILTVHYLGTSTAFHSGHYYRMYYGFYNSKDSLYYKGHGDLLIE